MQMLFFYILDSFILLRNFDRGSILKEINAPNGCKFFLYRIDRFSDVRQNVLDSLNIFHNL